MSFNVCLHILYHSTEFCCIDLEWNGFQPGWYLEQEEKFALFEVHCTVSNCMDQHAMNWIVTNTLIGAMGEKKWVDPILLCWDLSPNPAPCYIDQPHSKETRCACRLQKRPTKICLCPFDVWQACQIEKSIYRWKRQVH